MGTPQSRVHTTNGVADPRRSGRVDVDAPSRERGTELVQLREAAFGLGLVGGGEGEDERFDDDERAAGARKETTGAPAGSECRRDPGARLSNGRVGEEN